MAIYHFEAKVITRSKGRSVAAASAYASCSQIYNDYDGVQHDYTRKRGNVYSDVFLPSNAPSEWQDRETLWNAVEAAEKAKDSQLARELIVALPIELELRDWKEILHTFISENCVSKGMCADVNIHNTDGHNPHAHILLTMRPLDEKGKWQAKTQKEYLCKRGDEERGFTADEFKTAQTDGWEKQYQYFVGKKKVYMTRSEAMVQGLERASKYPKSTKYGRQNPICSEWNSEEQITKWRKAWEDVVNKSLELKNINGRIDCRSFTERGIDEQPTIHEGVSARIIEQRGGVSDRCKLNRQIRKDNAFFREIKEQIKQLSAVVKKSVSAIAHTLEQLRNKLIFNRYKLKHNDNISEEIKQDNITVDVTIRKYNGVVKRLNDKTTELKKLQSEQKTLSPLHIFRHNELTKQIEKTEIEIEELENLKSAFLDRIGCKSEKDVPKYQDLRTRNDNILARVSADNLELEKQYAADKDEVTEIKKSIPPEDMSAVQAKRYAIRYEYEKSNLKQLQEKYGRDYSYALYKSAENDVNTELYERPQLRKSVRKQLRQQRTVDNNCQHKQRNNDIER